MQDPTLLFCVGATKAGTSWLHRYLSQHPSCFAPELKELHYFDGVESGDFSRQSAQIGARRDRLLANGAPPRRLAELDHWDAVLRNPSDAAYLDFLRAEGAGKSVVTDITPAYGLLPAERLSHMARLLPDVRFIYLIRDPVSRLWSHVRMMAERRTRQGGDLDAAAARVLTKVFSGQESEVARRSDYRTALEQLKQAVDPARLFIGFYETLFSSQAVGRICAFLGIPMFEGPYDREVLKVTPLRMTDDQKRAVQGYLAPQYDYIAETLGPVPAAWHDNMMRA